MINGVTIEICLGNIRDVKKLNGLGIDRIELNSALELGGLTPSLNTLIKAKEDTDIKIICMVRTRGGDFCYTDEEYDVMFKDAKLMLDNGADGIVFGFLNKDNTINTEKTKKMVELIHSYGDKDAVFHKAFDEMNGDIFKDTKALLDLGIDRILTSGRAIYPDIISGCNIINKLYKEHGDKIQLLPGGGVRVENIQDVIKTAGTGQVHMTSKKTYDGNYIGLDEKQLEDLLNKIKTM